MKPKIRKTNSILPLALCLLMLVSFISACGGSQPPSDGGTTAAAAVATTAAATTAAPAATTAKADSGGQAADTTTAKAADATTAQATTAAAIDDASPPLEITFFFWAEKPNQMDDIVDYFNQTGGKELNMTWKTTWTPLDDYKNLIKLKLSAGEPVDACFDAQWLNMLDFIRMGNYHDLSPYFLNPSYPGLEQAFDASFLANNMFGTGKTYGVPITQAYGTAPLVLIRGDLREKYGVPPVKSLDDYRAYLQAIVDNEPNTIPLATNPAERHVGTITNYENDLWSYERMKAGIWDGVTVTTGVFLNASVYVKDYKAIACAFDAIDPDSAYADYPSPYNMRGMSMKNAVFAREFYEKGYLDKDFMNVTSMSGVFTSGKGASLIWDTANYISLVNTLKLAVPESVVEVYQPSNAYRDAAKGMLKGNYQAWNFVCVPVTTPKEKLDKIMEFYNWIFSSWDNHDLLELGIPGKNFEAVGTSQFKIPEGVDPATNYNMPGYQLLWNPNFIRLSADIPGEVVTFTQRGNDPDSYYNSLFSGFTFDQESIEIQLANPDVATLKLEADNIQWGIVANVEQAFADLDAKTQSNATLVQDLNIIKAEFMRQVQEYLDVRKVEDTQNGVTY